MTACFAEGNDPGWKHCGSAVLERLTQVEHHERREGKYCGHRCLVVEAGRISDCLYSSTKVTSWP